MRAHLVFVERRAAWAIIGILGAASVSLAVHNPNSSLAWVDHYKGRGEATCCGDRDCEVTTVMFTGKTAEGCEVMIGDHVLIVPCALVRQSETSQGVVCFVSQEHRLSVENIRCLFYAGVI